MRRNLNIVVVWVLFLPQMKQNLGFKIGIARHRIKHGLSSMISFFEPPGRSGGRGRGHDSGDGRGGIEVVGKVIGEEVVTVHGGG